jgi:zinc/manganese transport system substrate-binding protein
MARTFSEGLFMTRFIIAVGAAALLGAAPPPAAINVVTTTSDLAAIASEIGGDKINVTPIAKGYQDPHFVESKPSFMLTLNKARLLIVIGRELEVAWLPPLITQSRNARVQPGADGYLDASQTVKILDLPTTAVTRAMGDVHPQGNPHYWLDPENGGRIAKAIAAKLSQIDPPNAAYYAQREAEFSRRLGEARKRWAAQTAPLKRLKVVTYHRSWTNFADAFGLDVVGFVEPKPGIPPTPQHTLDVINAMKAQNVKIILVEPYFDSKTPNSIAAAVGGKVLVMPPSVGGVPEAGDYFKLFDYDVALLLSAIKGTAAK